MGLLGAQHTVYTNQSPKGKVDYESERTPGPITNTQQTEEQRESNHEDD